MNANTIVGFQGGTGRNNIIEQTGNTAGTATAFQVQTDSGTPVTAVLSIPYGSSVQGASSPLDPNANSAITAFDYGRQYGRPNGTNAPWYSSTSFDFSRPFKVRITGVATSNAASTELTIGIYLGTSTSGTLIASLPSGTTSIAAAEPITFSLETEVIWSAATGTLVGIHTGLMCLNTTAITPVVGTANTSGAAAAASNLQFVAAATWATASGSVSVTEFSIEQV